MSISRSVLAARHEVCRPMARAASCTSLNWLSAAGKFGFSEDAERCRLRHQLMQQAEPLGFQRAGQNAYAGDVSARPVVGSRRGQLDRIAADD